MKVDPQKVIDEYARRLHAATNETVALTVANATLREENESLAKRLADIARENGDE